jgi:peptide/nickel transport system substrate-binding protein/oligopeptide transport system substrate-binding protein
MSFFLALVTCSAQNRLDDHLYYRLNANPTTLDPAMITDVQASLIAAKLFNGLVRLNERLEVSPDIAARWEISHDGLSYRFFLKEGFLFSYGRAVTAQDFKYSFERVLRPSTRSPNTWIFDNVEGAKSFREGRAEGVAGFRVVSPSLFEIRLIRPFSPFLKMLTMTSAYVVPKEIVDAKGADFAANPAGTGPYILGKWLPNQEVLLKRNERYFDGTALLKGIVFRIIPEDLTALSEFELGNIDILQIPASAYQKLNNDNKRKQFIESIRGLNTYYLGLNTSRPPLDNPELRRAITVAIDRQKVLDTFYEGRGRLAKGPVPDLLRSWDLDKDGSMMHYNPLWAKRMIQKQGLYGTRFALYVPADQEVVDLAEIIQGYLSDAGLNIVIHQLEWSAYKEAINKGEPDMFWLSWWADYPDPENFLFPLFDSANIGPAGNRTRYINREVDRLIEAGQHSVDERQRDRSYQKAEEIIVSEAPWVSFWHKTDHIIRQPWVSGFKTYPIYTMDKGLDVSLGIHNH